MKHLLSFLFITCLFTLHAQDSSLTASINLVDMSLEELMNLKVEVASQKAATVRETPGAITVITEDDIKKSGAVEITELLTMIPGFDTGRDYGNNVSFGVRGNWGMEGKILIMIDGQMLNETSYGTAPTKNRIPLNQVKRIEIIRGPGSVIYGGVASLAVISIITKSGEDLKGISTKLNYEYSENATSGYAAEVNAGTKIGKLNLAIHAGTSNINMSNQKIDVNGQNVNYKDSSFVKNSILKVKTRYGGLSIIAMLEDYRLQRTYEYPGAATGIYTTFAGTYFGGEYKWNLSKKIQITPSLQWKEQAPWNVVGDSAYNSILKNSYRTQTGIKSTITLHKRLSLLLGTEYYFIKSTFLSKDTTVVFASNKKKTLELDNVAGFAEFIYSSYYGNLMAGCRYDHHSVAGEAFVPRLTYTKAWKKIHTKITYSKSFRTPLVLNVDLNTNLKPEFVTVFDVEGGVSFIKDMYVTVNLYDTKITDALVYITSDGGATARYSNEGTVGTRGIEAQWQLTKKKINTRLSYSFFTPYENTVTSFQYENKKNVLMGISSHKLTAFVWIPLHEKITVSSSLMWIGKRYSYQYDTAFNLIPYHSNPKFIWNIFVASQDILLKGISVQVGVKDLLNSGFTVVMPYQDGLSEVPFMRREFQLRILYDLKFKNR